MVQKETDVIMSQQMIAISEELDGAGIRVMFDDSDGFVLLLHFYRLTAPNLQSQPQQVNPFCSIQSHPTFKRAFEDTHVSLGVRC